MKLITALCLAAAIGFSTAAADAKKEDSSGEKAAAKTKSKLKYTRFKDGNNIFDGDGLPYYDEVPEAYKDRKISIGKYQSKEASIEFSVEKAGTVTVLVPPNNYWGGESYKTLKSEGWIEGDPVICPSWENKTIKFVLMEKVLEEGSYTLPTGGAAGTRIFK